MSAQSDSAVEAMNLAQVHTEMKLLCRRINADGHLCSSDEDFIADLRRHSKKTWARDHPGYGHEHCGVRRSTVSTSQPKNFGMNIKYAWAAGTHKEQPRRR